MGLRFPALVPIPVAAANPGAFPVTARRSRYAQLTQPGIEVGHVGVDQVGIC
jgi:hypothetical protein